mgnify:FL=1
MLTIANFGAVELPNLTGIGGGLIYLDLIIIKLGAQAFEALLQ